MLDHAVFSMHTVSFVLISSLAFIPGLWLIQRSHGAGLVILLAVVIWQFAYVATGIRRFYFADASRPPARSRVRAIGAALLVYLLNSAFITAIQLIGGAIALNSL